MFFSVTRSVRTARCRCVGALRWIALRSDERPWGGRAKACTGAPHRAEPEGPLRYHQVGMLPDATLDLYQGLPRIRLQIFVTPRAIASHRKEQDAHRQAG